MLRQKFQINKSQIPKMQYKNSKMKIPQRNFKPQTRKPQTCIQILNLQYKILNQIEHFLRCLNSRNRLIAVKPARFKFPSIVFP